MADVKDRAQSKREPFSWELAEQLFPQARVSFPEKNIGDFKFNWSSPSILSTKIDGIFAYYGNVAYLYYEGRWKEL